MIMEVLGEESEKLKIAYQEAENDPEEQEVMKDWSIF